MNKTNLSREVSNLTALVSELVAYWKAIAERNFKDTHPFSDMNEFEQCWPRALDNFFLMETTRTAKILRSLFAKGCNN